MNVDIKIGGFATFCIAVVVMGGIVSCVEAVANRPRKEKQPKVDPAKSTTG